MKRFLLTAAAVAWSFSGITYAQVTGFDTHPFSLPEDASQLVVADLNGDGAPDLLTVLEDRLRVYFQNDAGFDFDSGFDEIIFSNQSVGWDLSTGYHRNSELSVVALMDGKTVQTWQVENNRFQAPEIIKTDLNGFLGKGISRLLFSRDIDRDGLEDLVIPSAGKLNIYIKAQNGEYQAPLSVQSDFRIRTVLDSARLDRRLGQAVRIPQLELRDVNGDSLDDLVSRTEERLDVFLASQQNAAYFPSLPSYSLDIEEIQERLGRFDIENLDFSNLTGILALTHEEVLEDATGDGIDDLLLREGGKVSLFTGTISGMDLSQPEQVLRSGGNVLSTFLYDENEDGLKDLWLWRVEPISVGDVFMWLALSGSIAIEAFIYPNEGQRFARRPSRKITIDLKFPSVIRLANSFRELESDVTAANTNLAELTAIADLDSATASKDLLLLANNQLSVFMEAIEPRADSEEFLGSLGYSRSQDSYAIDIKAVIDKVAKDNGNDRSRLAGLSPNLVVSLAQSEGASAMIPARINSDEFDDLLIFKTDESGLIKGLLLLSSTNAQ